MDTLKTIRKIEALIEECLEGKKEAKIAPSVVFSKCECGYYAQIKATVARSCAPSKCPLCKKVLHKVFAKPGVA